MSDDRTRISKPAAEQASADADSTRIAAQGSARSTSSASGANAAPTPAEHHVGEDPALVRTAVRVGETLAHTYRIEGFLASGGMGAVYRARHLILKSEHAIKVILSELADDARVVELLSQEAKALSKVKNDAVVEYQGLFIDDYGRRNLVMEYVDGPSLARILRECRLSPADVRSLRDRLAGGLAAAHDKGVFHRDISPDNILLPGGRVDKAKIIDFGIAKHTDTGEKTIIGGDFAGKLSYASPEQLGMYGGKVDARSDLYSLGLVLATCAIGFGGKVAMGDSPNAVYQARQSLPDLSSVPEELRGELAAMLQPNPEDRPQDMREIIGWRPDGARTAPVEQDHSSTGTARNVAPKRGVGRLVAGLIAGVLVILGLSALAHAVHPEFLLRRFGRNVSLVHANLQRDFAGLRCAYLTTRVTQDYLFRLRVNVEGVVGSEADAKRVIELARLGGGAEVRAPLDVLPWPLCEAASLARAMSEGGDSADQPGISANQPTFIFHDGDQLVLKVAQSRRFGGFLYVDYLDPSGEVLHMLPAPREPNHAAMAGEEVPIGLAAGETAPGGQIFKVTPPFGTQLILAISTRQPLFPVQRPRSEPAGAYLEALHKALDDAQNGADATSAYRLMQTVPKT